MKLFLIGFMGSGKSYWGERLAAALSLPFFDLDEVIISREKRTIETIFNEDGEEYFRITEKDCLYNIAENTQNLDGFVVSCGGGTPCFFNNIEFMKKQGKVIWINPPIAILLERLMKEKKNRPALQGISDEQLLQHIKRKLGERKMYYSKADLIIEDEKIILEHFLEIADHA